MTGLWFADQAGFAVGRDRKRRRQADGYSSAVDLGIVWKIVSRTSIKKI
jgi:hypothetical protein